MTDIRTWLEGIGLGKHAQAFADNDVDFDVLGELSESDLEHFGLSFGDRKRALKAIRELAERPPEPHGATPTPAAQGEAERRQLTVMFCDLAGSTALSEGMDPEDYRELLAAYQASVSASIQVHLGYIARFLGDGVLAYFGYPVAHEDDAERAVRAGLAVVDAVAALDLPVTLAVRVGIATGPVVVGDLIGEGASEEAAVLGETPNLAARLQGAAAPDSVLLSAATQALLRGRVETRALAPMNLKGLSRPLVVHRALRPRSLTEVDESRRHASPLIGRDVELALLERAWRHTQVAEGQAVLLSGEAGVGKSRILRALREAIGASGYTRVQWHCSPYHEASANQPFIEQLQRSTRLDGLDTGDSLEGLHRMLEALGLEPQKLIPVLAPLLAIPPGERYTAASWSPGERKRRLVAAQVDLLLAAALAGPVLFVIEDLHWADPSTLEVLGEMVAAIRGRRVMMLLTARSEFVPPWAAQDHFATQRLRNLSRTETAALVRGIVEERGLDAGLIEQIVDRTDGVPLYVEELTKNLLEAADDARVPFSLQDLLTARLDRLGQAKEVAQLASVVGRQFSRPGLAALFDGGDDQLEAGIEALLASGLVQRRRSTADDAYEFKHALVRDTAYDALLRRKRQALHARLLEHFEAITPAAAERPVELLAHHARAAHAWPAAFDYLRQAASRAAARGANSEALSLFDAALAAAAELPEDDALIRELIAVRAALRAPLHALGHTDRLRQELTTALAAAELLGDRRDATLFNTYLSNLYRHRGAIHEALRAAEQANAVAQELDDRTLMICSAFDLGQAQRVVGQLASSAATCDRGLALITAQEQGERFGRPASASVLLRYVKTEALADLGDLGSAREQAAANVALADALDDQFARCAARWGLAVSDYWAGALDRSAETLCEICAIVTRERLQIWSLYPGWMLAELHARSGRVENAEALCRAAIQTNHALGYSQLSGRLATALGFVLHAAGQVDVAEQQVRDGLDLVRGRDAGGEAWCAWLAGQVVADPDAAVQHLERAHTLALRYQMRPLVALSELVLCRRHGDQGNEAATRALRDLGMAGWVEVLG